MKITYYGHSCVGVSVNGKEVLFDPFISGNPLASTISIDSIEADLVVLTHGHADHVADAKAIVKRTGAQLVSNYEIINWFAGQGVEGGFAMNTGGNYGPFEGIRLKCVQATHSSTMPDGSDGGDPNGYVVFSHEANFYHAGDTGLMMDMKLLADYDLDFAFMPIGDVFTMGVEDAVKAASFIDCNKIVGVHFDTFPPLKIDQQAAIKTFSDAGKELILLDIGETKEI